MKENKIAIIACAIAVIGSIGALACGGYFMSVLLGFL